MTQERIGIADVQCWVFRKAQRRGTSLPPNVRSCSGNTISWASYPNATVFLHVCAYGWALEDVEDILRRKGVTP